MISFPPGYHPLEQQLNCRVLSAAEAAHLKVYLVGGYVRDALLSRYSEGHPPLDFDYAVAGGSAIAFARSFCQGPGEHFVLLDESQDTARVVLDTGEQLDFAGCVGSDICSDVARRDFSINALVWDPDDPDSVLDLAGGLQDLQARTVRAISAQNLEDDPLRMLRAFRFSTTLGGEIEPGTLAMIKARAPLLEQSAPERISYELFSIARSPETAAAFFAMGESGLLEVIFPELTDTREVTPNAYHHLGLWDHSLVSVAEAEKNLSRLPPWVHNHLASALSAGVTRLQATKVACLLHDIGKPATWRITPEGRHSFFGHDRLGADLCESICERLRWSRPVSRFIVKLVRWHLRPGQLFHQGDPTDKAIHRFYRAMADEVPPLMVLALGDFGATCGPGLAGPQREVFETNLIELLNGYPVFLSGQLSMRRLLDGNQIMQILGIQPGPELGEILEMLREAQSLKEVHNRAEAEDFVISYYRDKCGK